MICNRKMDKEIADAVLNMPAGGEAHRDVLQAIDEFEEAVAERLHGDKLASCCVKYCRRCELACPLGK